MTIQEGATVGVYRVTAPLRKGGIGEVWRRDGRELYHAVDDRDLMVVPVRTSADGSTVEIGTPELLFSATFKPSRYRQPFDTIDGQTFVINRASRDFESSPLTLVVSASNR